VQKIGSQSIKCVIEDQAFSPSYDLTPPQCFGSGSEIRCLFDPSWILDPGGQKSRFGFGIRSGINSPDHISKSLEPIFGLKYLNSSMRIWILDLFDPETGIQHGKNSDPAWKKF
jgi:hypothetical protein